MDNFIEIFILILTIIPVLALLFIALQAFINNPKKFIDQLFAILAIFALLVLAFYIFKIPAGPSYLGI